MGAMELMAPAGSFQAALQAYRHGADAVYAGLKQFSARHAAENFSFEELRRLAQYARKHGKHLYIALNTVIRDDELGEVLEVLHRLVLLQIDGLIVQDLGLAEIVRTRFPSLPLHGSTQMAVHNASGADFLKSIGFTRIVLARELTFEEIAHIRRSCPDIELEVFVHGALCYSFSGLCLASGTLLGRSANRGMCAQICRTWFTRSDEKTGKETCGYFFSMKDLSVGTRITELQSLGIDAAKIEGRMKSPEYAGLTAEVYRRRLDGGDPTEEQERKAAIAFTRSRSSGWMFSWQSPDPEGKSSRLTHPPYPGQLGIPAGMVLASGREWLKIRTGIPLALRDGLQILTDDPDHPGLKQPHTWALTRMQDASGRAVTSVPAGVTVSVQAPHRAVAGEQLYAVSAHDLQLSRINPAGIELHRYQLQLNLLLLEGSVQASAAVTAIDFTFSQEFPLTLDRARDPRAVGKIFSDLLLTSDQKYAAGFSEILITNGTDLPDDRIFIPPKELKAFKRSLLEELHQAIEDHIITRSAAVLENHRLRAAAESHGQLPERSAIPETGALIDGHLYLPLPPIQLFGEDFRKIERQIAALRREHPGTPVAAGISNVGQIPWFREQEQLLCYIEPHLYTANRFTAELLLSTLPNCIGAYYWLEDTQDQNRIDQIPWPLPVRRVDSAYSRPLFISRSCYRHDSLGLPCSGCGERVHTYYLLQQGKRYRAEVRSCITYLYSDQENRP